MVMRIALDPPYDPWADGAAVGGVERVFAESPRRPAARGHPVAVVSTGDGGAGQAGNDAAINALTAATPGHGSFPYPDDRHLHKPVTKRPRALLEEHRPMPMVDT